MKIKRILEFLWEYKGLIILSIPILLIGAMYLYLMFPISSIIPTRVHPLPIGAANGEWSAQAVEQGHPSLFDSIDEMTVVSRRVVRGEIIGITQERIALPYGERLGRPAPNTNHVYTVYQFKVLEIYRELEHIRGWFPIGEVLNIAQVSRLENTNTFPPNYPDDVPVHYIRLPLHVGDELILFIDNHWPPLLSYQRIAFTAFHPIQGAYRYTSKEHRTGDNWIFESVNEHNNLVLTEQDLERIRDGDFR